MEKFSIIFLTALLLLGNAFPAWAGSPKAGNSWYPDSNLVAAYCYDELMELCSWYYGSNTSDKHTYGDIKVNYQKFDRGAYDFTFTLYEKSGAYAGYGEAWAAVTNLQSNGAADCTMVYVSINGKKKMEDGKIWYAANAEYSKWASEGQKDIRGMYFAYPQCEYYGQIDLADNNQVNMVGHRCWASGNYTVENNQVTINYRLFDQGAYYTTKFEIVEFNGKTALKYSGGQATDDTLYVLDLNN